MGNTWSANNCNTIKKRLEKTGIQGGRFALSFGIGYVEGLGIKACVKSAPETYYTSLSGLAIIGGIDFELNKFLDNIQNKIYKKLEIR